MPNNGESTFNEDLERLRPPRDVHDVDHWNRYWKNCIQEGSFEFNDLFIHDLWLLRVMRTLNFQSILCAGNGISLEPMALAYAGFNVTAVDLSREATEFVSRLQPSPKHLKHFFYRSMGRLVRDRGEVLGYLVRYLKLFLETHNDRSSFRKLRRDGGTIEFFSGNLLDPEFCPGPFDVIIERRMAQLFPDSERDHILQRLTTRLKPNGIFISQCHMGWWKPGIPRTHFAETWFREHGYIIPSLTSQNINQLSSQPGRIAVLSVTSG